MTFSLHQLARSRRLRAMGVLAWLMLVVNATAAAPVGMSMMSADAVVTTMAAVEHGHEVSMEMAAADTVAGCTDRTDCCGNMAGNPCTCAAMCVTALTPIMVVAIDPMAFAAIYAMPRLLHAPALAAAPPLRPPAV